MKPITILSLGVTLVLSMTSCNKFLDENPYSSLVEPDNASKIEITLTRISSVRKLPTGKPL